MEQPLVDKPTDQTSPSITSTIDDNIPLASDKLEEYQENSTINEEEKDITSTSPKLGDLEHPLQYSWTLWYYIQPANRNWDPNDIKPIYTFSTVEDFWRLFNNLKTPNQLKVGSDYCLFKKGIKPHWEDEKNRKGGKWILVVKQKGFNIDVFWLNTVLAMIGETIIDNDEMCGIVVSSRRNAFKLAIWTKTTNEKNVEHIGTKIKAILELPNNAERFFNYEAHQKNIDKYGPQDTKE